MKKIVLIIQIAMLVGIANLKAQDSIPENELQTENPILKISGEFLGDERFLLNDNDQWFWNENRLSLKLEKKSENGVKFFSEIWFRNFGLPAYQSAADLYNKGILNPNEIEIRELYVSKQGFLFENLDVKLGRQRIAWGTADKLNPTDNLNAYDLEDLLDFGRHRASNTLNMNLFLNNEFSLQAVYIPFFEPTNLPVSVFANVLNSDFTLPQGMTLTAQSNEIIQPEFSFLENAVYGFKFKGYAKGIDFSLSYLSGRDALPTAAYNTFTPTDGWGGVSIHSNLEYAPVHVLGFDLATNIANVGVWAETALYFAKEDVHIKNNLSAFYPYLPQPVISDSIFWKKTESKLKWVVGGDYHFSKGGYINFQYLHGFIHERGNENLSDYFFLRYEKTFFNEKLKLMPLSGAFIVTDWENLNENFAYAYMPEVVYFATPEMEISLSAVLFEGKGNNLFAGLKDLDMLMFKLKYSF